MTIATNKAKDPVACAITVEPEGWILKVIVEQCLRHARRVHFEPVDAYQPIPDHHRTIFYSTWCHYYAQPKTCRRTPHVALMTHFDYLAWRVLAMTLGQPSRILCMSNLYRRRLRYHGISSRKLILAPLGFDPDLFEPGNHESRPNKICVGLVGRLYPDGHKGEEMIEKIIRQLDPARFAICIVGSRWEPMLERLKNHPVEIRYHSMVETGSLPGFYRQMDALLIASIREGGPVTALEALACGTPLISRPVGYVPDLLGEMPEAGRLFRTVSEALSALNASRAMKIELRSKQDKLRELLNAYTWASFTRHVEDAVLNLHEELVRVSSPATC